MLTDNEIEAAKLRIKRTADTFHEHNDCIRLAYEWFDAQKTLSGSGKRCRELKHVIERWAGRYVSTSDVEVAAILHPRIEGKYPYFNLSARTVLPNDRRFGGIGEALTQNQRERLERSAYDSEEA